MNVLHIIPTYYPAFSRGGPVRSVHSLNKWLVKQGAAVTVYATDLDISEDVPRCEKVNVDGVEAYYFPASFPKVWEYSCALHKKLRDTAGGFSLIHITSTFLAASALGAHYARKYGVPYIISPRGNLMREPMSMKSALLKKLYLRFVEKRNLENADAIHFTVPKEQDEYKELGLSCGRNIVIPNGIEPEEFEEAEQGKFRRKFNIEKDKKIVLFLSRIVWKKGSAAHRRRLWVFCETGDGLSGKRHMGRCCCPFRY